MSVTDGNTLDDLNNLTTFISGTVGPGLLIIGGLVGVCCAGFSGVALWKRVCDSDSHMNATPWGLIGAFVVSSCMTIFAVIISLISLMWGS